MAIITTKSIWHGCGRAYKPVVKLGNFEGGMQNLLDLLADAITEKGATICLNTRVEKIDLDDIKPIITANGDTQTFDHVISTTSPRIMLKMTPRLQETAYGDQMTALKSIGGLCVVFSLKQQLLTDGTYWLNLPAVSPDYQDNEFPYLALVEHTNFLESSHYNGDHIIYCGDYVEPDHDYFQWDDEQLIEHFIPSLTKANPNFNRDWINEAWVFRAPYAQPIPLVGHSANIPDLRTPLPGVLWASMSQVYPWDRGTNYSVEIGRRVARIILGQETRTSAVIE
ncbi:MAG: FAD-dependent oxidoreductase [Chloroflexota bacterium]